MIETIINNIRNSLISSDYKNVYSAFDSIPYYSKNSGILTYINVTEFETYNPVYAPDVIFIPFSAVVEINVNAPADCSAEILFRFFSEYILPKLNDSDYHIHKVKKISLKPDTNLKKLVLKYSFCMEGIFRKEISSDE